MPSGQGFRNEALGPALDGAIAGDARTLWELLARLGGLPGPRANIGLVAAFAAECAARGKRADALIAKMATLDVEAAPGASKYEILPMCGVAALGARASTDPSAMRALSTLHDCAEDLRYRVREQVWEALARLGEARGEPLVHDLAGWMDGMFHAGAVLEALTNTQWLARMKTGDAVIARLDEAFLLVRESPRAASRYPGFKALVEGLAKAPVAAAMRFGVPVFDLLEKWALSKDEGIRAIVARVVASPKLTGRFNDEVVRVRAALTSKEKPRRDPKTYVGPTRRRGQKAQR